MSINLTPPLIQLVIAGEDLTLELMGGNLSRSRLNERSGLLIVRGNLNLVELDGGQSLDPFARPSVFNRGKPIELKVWNGVEFIWHNFGKLFITELEWNDQTRLLNIGVADQIGYTLSEGKTDAIDTGYIPPNSRSFDAVVNSLLSKLKGIPPLSGSLGDFRIDESINISNYWTVIGGLAFSAGKVIYTAPNGKLRVRTPPLGGSPHKVITLGQDEVSLTPNAGIEFPPGLLRITGTRKRSSKSDATGTSRSVQTIYAPGYAIGLDSPVKVPVEKIIKTEFVSERVQRRTVDHQIALGKAVSNLPSALSGLRRSFVTGEDSTESRYFERTLEAYEKGDGGKLLRTKRSSRANNPFALKAFFDWLMGSVEFEVAAVINPEWISFLASLINGRSTLEDFEESYTYTSKNVLSRKKTSLRAQIGDFATGYDWLKVLQNAGELYLTVDNVGIALSAARDVSDLQEVVETWEELSKNKYYRYERLERRALGSLGVNQQVNLHQALGSLLKVDDQSVKGSQVRPPDPGRAVVEFDTEEEPFKHEHPVDTLFPSDLSENERVVDVPYLTWFRAREQAEFIAKQFECYLIGKAQGKNIKTGFTSDLRQIKPLPIFDVVDLSGQSTAYVADQETHMFEPTAYVVGFNLVRLGVRLPDVDEPFRQPPIVASDDEVEVEPNPDGSYPDDPVIIPGSSDDDSTGDAIIRPFRDVELLDDCLTYGLLTIGLEVDWDTTPTAEVLDLVASESALTLTEQPFNTFEFYSYPTLELSTEEGEEMPIPASVICTADCTIGGKAIFFPDAVLDTEFTFSVSPQGLVISALYEIAIQVHTWSSPPGTSLTGRIWIADLGKDGGTFTFTPTTSNRYLSVFARNPDNADEFDGCCVLWSGNTLMLMSF